MKKLIFSWLVLYTSIISAQGSDIYHLYGQVLDELGTPMPGASVVERNSLAGAATDQDGRFELRLSKMPAYLEISFIGYSTIYHQLLPKDFKDGKLSVSFQLNPRKEQLAEVVVEGKAYEHFFAEEIFEVLDFVFVEQNTLLLLKLGGRYRLSLMNEEGDSLATLHLPERAEGFRADCLGQRYLLMRDSVFALSFADSGVQLLGAFSYGFYTHKLAPCIGSNPDNLYYQFYEAFNQALKYYQSPMGKEGKSKLICEIADWEDIASKGEYGAEAEALLSGVPIMGSPGTMELSRFKDGFERMAWFNLILSKPIYNPLFAEREGVLIFNHLKDSVLVFDPSGALVKRYPIAYPYSKETGFAGNILRDYFTGRFYVCYEKGGEMRLLSLSGEEYSKGEWHSIKGYDFPKNLKIKNGVAYFLDHDGHDLDRLKLFRQKL